MARPYSKQPKSAFANVRLTPKERQAMTEAAKAIGLGSISEYVRHLHSQHLKAEQDRSRETSKPDYEPPKLFKRVGKGQILHGDSLGLLHSKLKPGSVDLIMTSPPFGLVRKKSYGNEDAHRYVEWFRPFADGFRRVLKENGSLVIDIGGAWKPGIPTRSLYHFELLISLCEEFGFHLCQEHYWWNPSKLPTPAEWVNIRRIRVKDAVNCVWWLSPTPFPRADNRRVLAPYSDSMKSLLKNGYKAKLRPSGHNISTKFQRDNQGSVPPNLLAIANTESNGKYQSYCRDNDLPVHPARFPATLPEYFIRMLTDPDDLVIDPFAGSCVTGEVSEALGRKWMCVDTDESYLQGALSRFSNGVAIRDNTSAEPYKIPPPCSLPSDDSRPLSPEGGRTREKKAEAQTTEPTEAQATAL